jgi:methylmalonyl-CoA mutase N-terminal domain/subunit
MGGTLRAIENGYVQREIQQAAYEYQKSIEIGERVVVGVNRYQDERATPLPILRIDPEVERSQVERLRGLRARRDTSRVHAALRRVEEAARSERNLMPAILEAVKAYATVGEISDALRKVFGEYQQSVVV